MRQDPNEQLHFRPISFERFPDLNQDEGLSGSVLFYFISFASNKGNRTIAILPNMYLLLILASVGIVWGWKCPSDTGFFPHETDCDRYYECKNNVSKEGLCPDGLVFNTRSAPLYLRCDSVFDVDCTNRPQLQKPFGSPKCERRNGLFRDKDDCRAFWNCVDGVATHSKCPEGLVYNAKRGNCDWPDAVNDCDIEKLVGFQCPENIAAGRGVHVYYAHPDDCRKHYACVKGEGNKALPRLLTCHYGLVYDIDSKRCEYPEKVKGCEDYYPELSAPAKKVEDVTTVTN